MLRLWINSLLDNPLFLCNNNEPCGRLCVSQSLVVKPASSQLGYSEDTVMCPVQRANIPLSCDPAQYSAMMRNIQL